MNVLDGGDIGNERRLKRNKVVVVRKMMKKKENTRTWYVALHNPTDEEIEYGVWTGTECPDDCGGVGECNFHMCECPDIRSGLGCEVKSYSTFTYFLFVAFLVAVFVVFIILVVFRVRIGKEYQSF